MTILDDPLARHDYFAYYNARKWWQKSQTIDLIFVFCFVFITSAALLYCREAYNLAGESFSHWVLSIIASVCAGGLVATLIFGLLLRSLYNYQDNLAQKRRHYAMSIVRAGSIDPLAFEYRDYGYLDQPHTICVRLIEHDKWFVVDLKSELIDVLR